MMMKETLEIVFLILKNNIKHNIMRKKSKDLVIVPKKENLIKYCINNKPDIKAK